jgi:hypothetical protein
MTDECHRCGIDSEHHGEFCDPADIVKVLSLDSRAGVADQRATNEENVTKAPPEDPVEKAIIVHPYPSAWDREPDQFVGAEWRVAWKRRGGRRSRSKVFQREFFAIRLYWRLLRQPTRMGPAPVDSLMLQEREVGEWITRKDLPWARGET